MDGTMTVQVAQFYAMGCLAVVFFQVALIGGLPLGAWTQGGRYRGALPLRGRLVAAVAVPVHLFQGLAIVSAAGFPGMGWPLWTGWVAFGTSVIVAVLSGFSPSGEERAVWLPVNVVKAALVGYVMLMTLTGQPAGAVQSV
jgi:hypothetical protein